MIGIATVHYLVPNGQQRPSEHLIPHMVTLSYLQQRRQVKLAFVPLFTSITVRTLNKLRLIYLSRIGYRMCRKLFLGIMSWEMKSHKLFWLRLLPWSRSSSTLQILWIALIRRKGTETWEESGNRRWWHFSALGMCELPVCTGIIYIASDLQPESNSTATANLPIGKGYLLPVMYYTRSVCPKNRSFMWI